jgi:proteasome accessory factor C
MSAAGERITRLLALVPWLRTHDGITVDEAAQHFGVSREQLEKDLWLLIVCGMPGYGPDQLIDIDFWDDGHIHVRDPQTLDVPLRLSYEEAAALIIALRLLAQLPGAPDAVHSALETLIAGTEIESVDVVVGRESNPDVVAALDKAMSEQRLVHMDYASGADGHIRQRTVEPQRLTSINGRHLMLGYCHEAEAERTFRLDRILTANVGEPYAPRTHQTEQVEPDSAVMLLDPSARWVIDVHPVTEVAELADGRLRVRIAVFQPAWLVTLVLRLGGAAEVVEPADMRAIVAAAARDAAAAYANGNQPEGA